MENDEKISETKKREEQQDNESRSVCAESPRTQSLENISVSSRCTCSRSRSKRAARFTVLFSNKDQRREKVRVAGSGQSQLIEEASLVGDGVLWPAMWCEGLNSTECFEAYQ